LIIRFGRSTAAHSRRAASSVPGLIPVDREPLGEPSVYGDDPLFVSLRLVSDAAEGEEAKLDALEQAGRPVVRIVLDDLYLRAHLGRAAAGDYVALLAYLPMTREHEHLLSSIRVLARDRLRVATCVGFGPRFQHSTGQAYKGGPNRGVFLQLTCRDRVDLQVPGRGYTFGVVKEAQARGDLDVLARRGRRALRIDLGADPTSALASLRDAVERALS
jgi:hypothetical protein